MIFVWDLKGKSGSIVRVLNINIQFFEPDPLYAKLSIAVSNHSVNNLA